MYQLPILEMLQDCHDPPLTPERIEELQAILGVRFPQDYVEFLLQFNGGDFAHPVRFDVPYPTTYVTGAGGIAFFGASYDPDENLQLLSWAERYEDRLPVDFLAVGHCNSGDLILLKLRCPEEEFGTVWFWDGVDEGEGNNIHWLADSFPEFLEMLMRDLYLEEDEHETIPIFQAVERGHPRAVEEFLAHGGDVESRNANGLTLLMAAIEYRWPKVARLLLEHAADPNARDRKGWTPLHYAATNSIDCVKLLLAAGANPKARDKKGKSVLAQWSYRADCILRAHGAEE